MSARDVPSSAFLYSRLGFLTKLFKCRLANAQGMRGSGRICFKSEHFPKIGSHRVKKTHGHDRLHKAGSWPAYPVISLESGSLWLIGQRFPGPLPAAVARRASVG